MPGKRVQFDEETWRQLDLLGHDQMKDFQELTDEAFRDLLKKYGRPVDLKDALRRSAGSPPRFINYSRAPAGSRGGNRPRRPVFRIVL